MIRRNLAIEALFNGTKIELREALSPWHVWPVLSGYGLRDLSPLSGTLFLLKEKRVPSPRPLGPYALYLSFACILRTGQRRGRLY